MFNLNYKTLIILGFFLLSYLSNNSAQQINLSAVEQLGKDLFFDELLSEPEGQSCASCHNPDYAFSSASDDITEGAVSGRFGNRNVPSISYSFKTPQFHQEFENDELVYVGGMFLDGRAANMIDQAKGPLLNPLEMNNGTEKDIINKVIKAGYKRKFEKLFGNDVFEKDSKAIKIILTTIVAYESSKEFGLFNSKYDLWLKGQVELTAQEKRGLDIFESDDKGHCSSCHLSAIDRFGNPPLFSEFDYDNIGVPKNSNNPYYSQDKKYNPEGLNYIDNGLGVVLQDKKFDGQFKVPTLRNIAITAPYMHNGVFETLEEVVDFYNTRDIDQKWQQPEVKENMNTDEMGDLKLNESDISALIAFLKTLTDNYHL